jgi:hypothetical protein
MKKSQYIRRSQKKDGSWRSVLMPVALVMGLLVCVTVTTAATFATESQSGGEQAAAPTQLTITISSQGMTPATATVRTGIVHLFLENPNGIESLKLRVTRGSGELVREINVPNRSAEWATELELSAGQYVITEANNPSWTCQLTAQAPPDNTTGQSGAGANP